MILSKIKKRIVFSLVLIVGYACVFLFQKDFVLGAEDLGRHIILGKIILSCRCIPQINLFSFTYASFPFINHHWLSEVIFYAFSRWFGIDSLLLLKVAILLFCITIMFFLSLKKGSLFWVTVISLVEIKIFSGRFHVRPELFSFLFIVLFLYIFDYYNRTKKTVFLYILPFLELLWVNMHIYFPVGIVMYLFFLFEKLIIQKNKIPQQLFVVFLVVLLTTLINPHGLTGALLPLTIFHNYGLLIIENQNLWYLQSVGFTSDIIFTFELLAIVLLVSFMRKLSTNDIFSVCFAIFGFGAAIMMLRNFPIFVFASWMPLVTGLTIFERHLARKYERIQVIVSKTFIIVLLILATCIVDITQGININAFGFSFLPITQPAVSFLQKHNIHGPYFNNVIIGSFLIYAFYPKERIFVDARPEAYPASFFIEYEKMLASQDYFDKRAETYKFTTAIIGKAGSDGQAFISHFLQSSHWKLVYKDIWTDVFVKS